MDTAVAATAIPTVPGTPYAGGFYMGRVFVGLVAYALVVAPKSEGEQDEAQWNKSKKNVAGALSYFDGVANTLAMAEAGSALAEWARNLRIGGFDDWFIPSRQDLLVIKGNEEAAGEVFAESGAEAFERDWYWSSTQHASDPDSAWVQDFDFGGQPSDLKDHTNRARAVRRVPL
jgi:uncharacterized protein DUF1566